MAATLTEQAWEPLPPSGWDEAAARHLLRRVGWTARPGDVERALAEGLESTLERIFPRRPPEFAQPLAIRRLEENLPAPGRRPEGAPSERERQEQRQELRELSQSAWQDLSIRWLQYARNPETAAFAKWAFFLSDVYVVSQQKVRQTNLVFDHQRILFEHAFGDAPTLTKAVSRSPAMIVYLDLQGSRRGAPNENFARELFELFVLGEGNYSEQDIKEAARAFTGYRQQAGEVRLVRNQFDAGPKTLFGRTGRFDGDAVIDLAYAQPAAATFLPRELARFYLAEPVPEETLARLGSWWRTTGFNLRRLALRFFSSRLFFEPARRGTMIKSPVQFYLGLLQDFEVDVPPVPRLVLPAFRQMGQILYQPPNVRGWVGGRQWINSSTLSARRQLVQTLLSPLNESILNADDRRAIAAARAQGPGQYFIADSSWEQYQGLSPEELASRLVHDLVPLDVGAKYVETLRAFIGRRAPIPPARIREAAGSLLQSPEYQLC